MRHVEVGRGLVEQQQVGLRDPHTLALSARELVDRAVRQSMVSVSSRARATAASSGVDQRRHGDQRLKADVEALRASVGEERMPPDVVKLIADAQRIAEMTEGFVGSCERGRPYAEMFLVARADNKLVWRCTHDPAHPDIEVG